MVDTTAGADISAGEVDLVGDVPAIAHNEIANGDLGALAFRGGVYEVPGDAVIAIGTKVYWDDTAKKVTGTAAGNKHFGTTVTACGGDTQLCDVLHHPEGIEGT